jgi:hypothetical protein
MIYRFFVCFIITGFLLLGCATTKSEQENMASATPSTTPVTADDCGIQVKSLRLTAGNSMLDFRYRITDKEKASALFRAKENKPYLVDLATGARLTIPELAKIGTMRTSTKNLALDKVNFMMFANPGMLLKRGSRAIVVIGDFRSDNLTVE